MRFFYKSKKIELICCIEEYIDFNILCVLYDVLMFFILIFLDGNFGVD